jgi:hypothetical protein
MVVWIWVGSNHKHIFVKVINKPLINKTMDDNNQNFLPTGDTALAISKQTFEKVEWVFQFNEDEPVRFATDTTGSKELTVTLGNRSDSNVVFSDGKGNSFKIFAREII